MKFIFFQNKNALNSNSESNVRSSQSRVRVELRLYNRIRSRVFFFSEFGLKISSLVNIVYICYFYNIDFYIEKSV